MADVVEDGASGILVAMDDDAALAAGVLAVLADRDRAAAMGRHGRGRVVATYSAARLVADIEALYTTLVGIVLKGPRPC